MKKRYQVTLTEEKVERFQAVAKQMGMPQNILSVTCDEAITQTLELFEVAAKKGKITLSDVFRQIAEMTKEGGNDEKSAQKAKTVAKRVKRKM